MLEIYIPGFSECDKWDEINEEFIPGVKHEGHKIVLEHSLISISKWEEKWCKPFLNSEKTDEEFIDYIRCMTITPNVPHDIYEHLTAQNYKEISDYLNSPMTATTIKEPPGKSAGREIITSELIYYWMITLHIPKEFEKWPIKRLIMLIRICEIKNQPPKKMSKADIMRQNHALNEARRKRFNTKG